MKNYLLTIVALVALSLASAQANLVTITWAPNHSSDAGEFVMTPQGGDAFDTFCVEQNQFINIGGTYSYTIANGSDGGVNAPNLTPVSLGTAWLYRNFRNGTLNGFTGTSQQQTDLQDAIWSLQGELAPSSNHWIELAQSTLGANVNLYGNGSEAFGVDVWNLFDANGNECQSQLGINSVPETGTMAVSLALLLPIALGTVVSRRRLI